MYNNIFELRDERIQYFNKQKEISKIDEMLARYSIEHNQSVIGDIVAYKGSPILTIFVNSVTVEWCEGNGDTRECFNDGDKFDSLHDFQFAIDSKDLFYRHKYGKFGYNKCSYILKGFMFTGIDRCEVFEYKGRIDIGDGPEYVNIMKNVSEFILWQMKHINQVRYIK